MSGTEFWYDYRAMVAVFYLRLAPANSILLAMDATTYLPSPIDTEKIVIPDGFAGLIEQLAENTHDLWARQRIKDGWVYGAKRDDSAKQHPCLVPYSQLPESEKEYDRLAVLGVFKAMLALGCQIFPPSGGKMAER